MDEEQNGCNDPATQSSGPRLFHPNHSFHATDENIERVMAYHPWSSEKIAKGQEVRRALGEALRVIINNVPPSADRSAAIRKLRECRMDCNSAITFNGWL